MSTETTNGGNRWSSGKGQMSSVPPATIMQLYAWEDPSERLRLYRLKLFESQGFRGSRRRPGLRSIHHYKIFTLLILITAITISDMIFNTATNSCYLRQHEY